jgi:hypothetical protein
MKIGIVLPCWGRFDVVQLILKQLEKLNDVEIIPVLSIEDPQYKKLNELFENSTLKTHICTSENHWLGEKHNVGFRKAAKLDIDWIMNLGSDDLLHPDLIELYKKQNLKNYDIIGIDSVFFYQYPEKLIYFKYYNKEQPVGAGRIIRRSFVAEMLKVNKSIYRKDLCAALDNNSFANMIKHDARVLNIETNSDKPYIIDIKTFENIHSFQKIEILTGQKDFFSFDKIFAHFGLTLNELSFLKQKIPQPKRGNMIVKCLKSEHKGIKLPYKVGQLYELETSVANEFIRKGIMSDILELEVKEPEQNMAHTPKRKYTKK